MIARTSIQITLCTITLCGFFAGCSSDDPTKPNGDGGSTTKDSTSVQLDMGQGNKGLTNLFFLHHSTGDGLVVEGDMRGAVNAYNTQHGTKLEFWDHEYNGQGLRDPAGTLTNTSYEIPGDNTDPDGLHELWTSQQADWTAARDKILSHQVIAFKSCFPASAIADDNALAERKTWYEAMRGFFDTRKDKLFVVMSTPPLHRLGTDATEAKNARKFATWLCSDAYLSGHDNVRCFDLFDQLAHPDDGSASANMLKSEYEMDPNDSDSHPNTLANQTVGPVFAQFLCAAARSY